MPLPVWNYEDAPQQEIQGDESSNLTIIQYAPSEQEPSDDEPPAYNPPHHSAEAIFSWRNFQGDIRTEFQPIFRDMDRHYRLLEIAWFVQFADVIPQEMKTTYFTARLNFLCVESILRSLKGIIEFDSQMGWIPARSSIQEEYDHAAATWVEVVDDLESLKNEMTRNIESALYQPGKELETILVRLELWWTGVELVLDDVVGQLFRTDQYELGVYDTESSEQYELGNHDAGSSEHAGALVADLIALRNASRAEALESSQAEAEHVVHGLGSQETVGDQAQEEEQRGRTRKRSWDGESGPCSEIQQLQARLVRWKPAINPR